MTLSLPPTNTPDGPTQKRGYEARDLSRRSVPIAVGVVLVCAVLLHLSTFWVFRFLQARPLPTDVPNSAVDQSAVPTNRNFPPVQKEDVRPLREHENAVFQKLGWDAKGDSPDVKIPDAVVNAMKERK